MPAPKRSWLQRTAPDGAPTARRLGLYLSEDAIRAIEEGRADHAAGRTFTMAEIRGELGIDS